MGTVKKVTFSLPAEIVSGIQAMVAAGEGASQSAVVREAVTAYLISARDRRLAEAFAEAALDEGFLRDNDKVLADFSAIDDEELLRERADG